jgi:teichuronic acid biosynthesis protein TuaE
MNALYRGLQDAFFAWGWLTPTLLPIAQVVGRAVFSILMVLYFMWGMISLYGRRLRIESSVSGIFVALLLALFMSIPGAEDAGRAWHTWLKFAHYAMSFVFTLLALQQAEENLERLYRSFAVAGVGLLGMLYLHLFYVLLTKPEFIPEQQLQEDNLPFLLPFLLYGLQRRGNTKHRIPLGSALLLSALFYMVLSEGRAGLLALWVALALYAVLARGWRLRTLLLPTLLAATALMAMVSAVHVEPAAEDKETWGETLDRVSSGRSVLWRQAFVYPPESIITGVGMGNGRYAEQALTLEEGQVRHFHNLFIDAWYETGLFGLIAITAWLIIILVRAWGDWLKSTGEVRRQLGLLLSASLAILVAAQLGPSYGSKLFSLYLFVLFAALTVLHDKAERAASGAFSP